MSEWLHPAWPYLLGAVILGVSPRPARRVVWLASPALSIALALTLPDEAALGGTLLGQSLVWVKVDPLARAFAVVFALIGGLGAVYGFATAGRRLGGSAFWATGSALGIVLAGDWLTFYLWWEMLAVASYVLVTDGASTRAADAALRYLLVHATGGALLLAGIVWLESSGGSPLVGPLGLSGPGGLVLLAFAINAAVPPLHAWLTDAYPESSPVGAVFLSAFATKSAVYALARVFPGAEPLAWAGAAMALYGVVFAVLENDIRRLLGYHIVSQVGYMVAGVGLGTPLALAGTVAHAFCHILYKGLLFMGAGAVVEATGRRKLTELGGLGRAMPVTAMFYMVGAFSISGAPLLNGFVSKSLIVAAAAAEHRGAIEWLLTLASVGTFLSVGLKLPYFTFGGPARELTPAPVPISMQLGMALTAVLCAAIGTFPALLYSWLPYPVSYDPYTGGHVLEALQILAGTGVGFLWLRDTLRPTATVTRDADRLYRAAAGWITGRVAPAIAGAAAELETRADALVARPLARRAPWASPPVGYSLLLALAVLWAALSLFRRLH